MKSPSIDVLYNQIDRHVLLTESYTEIVGLATIIKFCRLKPHSYVYEKKNSKITLYDWWFDEYGNSLFIKDKKIKIIYNDLNIQTNTICTDLYYGLSLDKILKISKLALIFSGKDEDLLQKSAFVTFLGIDNYLRSYSLMYNEWKQVSSLLLGIDNLKLLINNLDIRYFQELKINKNFQAPCILEKAWLTYLPVSPNLLNQLDKQDIIYNLFKE